MMLRICRIITEREENKMLRNCNKLEKSGEGKKAFTLTEVLLAVAIVGIIAALVLPMVVKNYQEKTLDAALKREKQTIESSIASLLINENTDDYKKTMLYTSETDPTGYATTSGAFITKYLKVSKYCGDSNGNCFASKYYEYKDGDKTEYTPTYKGACASLKNGSSICMEPKTPNHGVKILLDINGKKGPNVKGRDLHEYEITLPEKGSLDRTSSAIDWDYKLVEIETPCAEGETTEKCCESNFHAGCCDAFPDKYGSRTECKTCSATKGTDAECCTSSSEYANAHKSSCCSNIFASKGEEVFKSKGCCTTNPSHAFCQTTPTDDCATKTFGDPYTEPCCKLDKYKYYSKCSLTRNFVLAYNSGSNTYVVIRIGYKADEYDIYLIKKNGAKVFVPEGSSNASGIAKPNDIKECCLVKSGKNVFCNTNSSKLNADNIQIGKCATNFNLMGSYPKLCLNHASRPGGTESGFSPCIKE